MQHNFMAKIDWLFQTAPNFTFGVGNEEQAKKSLFVYIYVTAKMDVLGKTVLPRQNGFAGRQIRFAWTDQAKWIWNYFRSYLFV